MLVPLLLVLPWVAFVAFMVAAVRLPPPLPPEPGTGDGAGDGPTDGTEPTLPSVSVVIPARNEARNIRRVLDSVAASDYPDFEIVVVDDRSEDGTGELARTVEPGRARAIRVVDGAPLPAGWLGKPWACAQGAEVARGELLLFTDADTIHGRGLLRRAVAGLRTSGADALTVAGRQLMESFWERLVQPQIFVSMILRYFDLSRRIPRRRWRSAIANGQYILFRGEAYRALGGHERVKGEVVEDLRLAQLLVKDGFHLAIRRAESAFATRMYTSLPELVEGWSKNVILGGLQTIPRWMRPFTPPTMILFATVFWIVPPVALLASTVGLGGTGLRVWAAAVVAVSIAFWTAATRRFGAPAIYGVLYPLGSAVAAFILLRSWRRMEVVEWKGRRYETGLEAG